MKLNKKRLYKECLGLIEKQNFISFEELFVFLFDSSARITEVEFESLFDNESIEYQALKAAIHYNKTRTCNSLLDKWIGSNEPLLQIAAYKLLCDENDLYKLK